MVNNPQRPSVGSFASILSFEPTDLTTETKFCMFLGHDPHLALKIKIIDQGQWVRISLLRLRNDYRVSAVTERFYCHVVSCALARRGVRRGAAEVCDSGSFRRMWGGNTVTRSV